MRQLATRVSILKLVHRKCGYGLGPHQQSVFSNSLWSTKLTHSQMRYNPALPRLSKRRCQRFGLQKYLKNYMNDNKHYGLPVIGWREWVGLPELGIKTIKAKVDSGARSSSLHAFDLEEFDRDGAEWVRFKVHPVQRKKKKIIEAEAMVLEHRSVRSSSGKAAWRPVIITNIELLGVVWPVELTLARRDEMSFRMLLGREAFRRRFMLDAGKSYFGGKPKRKKRKSD